MTIGKASLTITADDHTKICGETLSIAFVPSGSPETPALLNGETTGPPTIACSGGDAVSYGSEGEQE